MNNVIQQIAAKVLDTNTNLLGEGLYGMQKEIVFFG